MSENELNIKVNDFQKKISDYNLQKNNFTKEINDKRINVTNSLLKSLNSILSDYASKENISLILQKKNIIVGKTSLDITNVIMKIFNENVKSLN